MDEVINSEAEEIYDLARRCIEEARNWRGTAMYRGLLDIARQLRERAEAIEARTALDRIKDQSHGPPEDETDYCGIVVIGDE